MEDVFQKQVEVTREQAGVAQEATATEKRMESVTEQIPVTAEKIKISVKSEEEIAVKTEEAVKNKREAKSEIYRNAVILVKITEQGVIFDRADPDRISAFKRIEERQGKKINTDFGHPGISSKELHAITKDMAKLRDNGDIALTAEILNRYPHLKRAIILSDIPEGLRDKLEDFDFDDLPEGVTVRNLHEMTEEEYDQIEKIVRSYLIYSIHIQILAMQQQALKNSLSQNGSKDNKSEVETKPIQAKPLDPQLLQEARAKMGQEHLNRRDHVKEVAKDIIRFAMNMRILKEAGKKRQERIEEQKKQELEKKQRHYDNLQDDIKTERIKESQKEETILEDLKNKPQQEAR